MAKQLKIVMLTPHAGEGGDWVIVKNMISRLFLQGHQLTLVTNSQQRPALDEAIDYVRVALNRGEFSLMQAVGQRAAFAQDVDVLHAHSPIMLTYAFFLKATRCRQAKVVMTFHWNTPDSSLRAAYKSWLFKRADAMHCYSLDIAEKLESNYSVPKNSIRLAYIGVDDSCFFPAAEGEACKAKQNWGIEEGAFVYAFVGRLNPEKRISWVLDYLAAKFQDASDVKFIVVGDGPCKAELVEQVKDLKLENVVHFLGRVSEPRLAYCVSDLLLLPSTSFETFGLVVTEAALCETPTLRSSASGAKDQIVPGESGFIFDLNEKDDFFAQMDQAYADRKCLKKMGKKAREHALSHFTFSAMDRELAKFYQGLF